MLKYFTSILIKRIPIIIAITAIFLSLTLAINNVNPYIEMKFVNNVLTRTPKKGFFLVFTYGIGIISFILPIIEYSFKMIKIQAHQAYSFPIKRATLFLARYLVGLIEIFLPFTISYFISVIFVVTSNNLYNISYLFIYYPMALISGLLIFSFFSFIYCRANNILDGILSMILSAISVIGFGLIIIILCKLPYSDVILYTPLTPLLFSNEFCDAYLVNEAYNVNIQGIVLLPLWGLIEVASVFAGYYLNQRIKTEDISKSSTSIFCYRMFLPMITILMFFWLYIFVGVWASILVLVFSLGVLIVFRRHEGLGLVDMLIIISTFVTVVLVFTVLSILKGAGIL